MTEQSARPQVAVNVGCPDCGAVIAYGMETKHRESHELLVSSLEAMADALNLALRRIVERQNDLARRVREALQRGVARS